MTATESTIQPQQDVTGQQASVEIVKRSLALLHEPGAVFEVRCLDVPAGRGYTSTASGYFSDYEKAATWVASYEAQKQPKGIYTTINSCVPALLGRANNRLVDRATDRQVL